MRIIMENKSPLTEESVKDAGQQNKILLTFEDKDGGNPELLAKNYQVLIKESLGLYGICSLRSLYNLFSKDMKRDLMRGLSKFIVTKADLDNWCFVAPTGTWIEDRDPRTIIFTSPMHWINFEALRRKS